MPPEIPLNEFLAQLVRNPSGALGRLGDIAFQRLDDTWWQLAIIVVLFVGLRNLVIRAQDRVILHKTLAASSRSPRRAYAQRTMLLSLAAVLLWSTFVVLVLGQIGLTFSPSTITWILGSLSLTVAFIARPYLADSLAGWLALANDHYGIGDYIDAEFGIAGTVIDVDLLYTTLRGADGTIYPLRNSTLARFGNKTRSAGRILTDVTLGHHDGQPVSTDDLRAWEDALLHTVIRLRQILFDVDTVASGSHPQHVEIDDVATVVPTLVPHLSQHQIAELNSLDADTTDALPKITSAIAQSPMAQTPLFREVEVLGLVTSTSQDVTIRMRVQLDDPRTRSYALVALRRHIFDEFAPRGIAAGFADVPEGEQIN